jgi:murein DD-endopeptidase MepM/ murein hydrolase activator NlpD
VTDPFRSPPNPFGPGNRGLEYGTEPGTPVVAIGPGSVYFAGQVGGHLYVTVRHPDGLRSSYAFLSAVLVASGGRVERGDVVGLAGPIMHLGVRCGDRYLDPSALFGAQLRIRLVPDRWFPGSAAAPSANSPRAPVRPG